MSVINKMLKDLEQDQSSKITLTESYIASEKPQANKIIGLLLLIILIFIGYHLRDFFSEKKLGENTISSSPTTAKHISKAEEVQIPATAKSLVRPEKNKFKTAMKESMATAQTKPSKNLNKTTVKQQGRIPEQRLAAAQLKKKPVLTQPVDVTPKAVTSEKIATAGTSEFSINKTSNSGKEQALRLWQQAESRPQKAEEYLLKALTLDPELHGARLQIVALMVSQSRVTDAERMVDRGLLAFPENPEYIEWKARLRIAANDTKTGFQWLLKVQPELATHINYYGMLATVASQLKHNEIAAETYQQLITLQPQQGPWLLGLAISLERLGQTETAIESYKRAQTAKALTRRAQIFIQQKLKKLES